MCPADLLLSHSGDIFPHHAARDTANFFFVFYLSSQYPRQDEKGFQMNQQTAQRADPQAQRPLYTGLDWTQSRSNRNLWKAGSETTPITYVAEEIDDGQWAARQGFPDSAGRPNIEIGRFTSMVVAMTACERHDFRFWSTSMTRAGLTPVFLGSPDHVSDFVGALADHEREDLLDMIAGGYALPDGRNFTHCASFFSARKTGLKQERSGDFTATFAIPAFDVPMWLMQTAPGTQVTVGIAESETPSDGDEWQDRAAFALKRSFALVQDNDFHDWMAQKYDRWGLIATAITQTSEEVEGAVSETLRRLIGCPSRRDLATNRDAVQRLEKIDREFYLDLSRASGMSTPG